MKNLKKMLCVILSTAMVVTSLTVTALGADDYTEVSTAAEFHDAFTGTAKIRLMADITCTKQEVPSEAGENVTIDLNGHKITGASKTRFYYTTKATTLTIEDSVGTGKIVGNSGSSYAASGGMFYISGGATLNINGGTFSNGLVASDKSGNYIYGYSNSTVNITAGRFESVASSGTALIYPTGSNSTLNISGGYIGTNSTGKSLWAYSSAKINITGNPIIIGSGDSSWPKTSFFKTFTGGYYVKDMSSYITDTTNYTQITLQTAVEGCTYKVTAKTANIKYFDGDTEYTDLSTTADAGSTVATAAAPTKAGYVFTGWNTEADGSGANYDAESETLFVDGDINLYAQWVEEGATTYDIKYFDSETEYTDLAKTVESGKTLTIEDAQAKGTLAFKEWNTSSDGTGTAYAPGTEVTASENLSLYAIWEESVTSVTVGSTTTYYASLEEAVTAAMNATTNGTTSSIKLLNNIELSSHINFATTASLTDDTATRTTNFDFNGFTITSSATDYLLGLNKFAKLNVYDNSENMTGAVKMTAEGGAKRYFHSPGWSGTQIAIYGGSFEGAKQICNYGNNANNACRLFGGNYNTITTDNGNVSPIPSEVGYEVVSGRYYVGAATVTVDDATKYFATFEDARLYLVGNVDAGEEGTIKLLADQSVSKRIYLYSTYSKENEQRTITFDFNGHTLSSSVVLKGIIGQNANDIAYIKDSSEAKTGAISMFEGSEYYLHSAGYSNNRYYISDITFSGAEKMGNYGATFYKVSSGTYDFDPTDYLADDTVTAINNGDGTWNVIKTADAPYLVTYSNDTSSPFGTYSQALESILAKDDKTGTIKVVTSELTETFALDDADAEVTIDLNGKSQKMSSNIPFASLSAGRLNIQNGTIDLTDKTDEAAKISVAADTILSLSNVAFTGAETPIESNGAVFVDGIVATSGLVNQLANAAVLQTVSGKVLEDVSLTITAAFAITDEASKITMKYQTNGETIEIEGDASSDGTYVFTTNGIMLINLDKDLSLEFYADDEKISCTTSITVQKYLNTVYKMYPDENTQNAFMAELIDFAAKLQAYNQEANGGATATIQYAGWEADYLLDEIPEDSDNVKATTVGVVDKTLNKIKSASISVSDKARLCFSILAQAGTKVVITKDDVTVYSKSIAEAGDQDIYLAKISPLDYDAEYLVTLYDGETILHQVKYSVNSYCFAKKDDEGVGAVAKAMFNYGKAAEYFKQDDELNFGKVSYVWTEGGTVCSASRTSADGTVTQSETVTATTETVTEGSGVIASIVKTTADFENPAFATQVTTAPVAKAANLTGSKTQTAWEKHLITNSDGSYGGSYDAATYGEGAPLNGALDNVSAGYYATNDYYNTKCTDTRTILTGFAGYQQTMADTDGIASVLMAMNYYGEQYTEKALLDKYEELNSKTVYGNGTTAAGLEKLAESYGFDADTTLTAGSQTALETLVENNLKEGKAILLRWQQAEKARWCVVIGIDTMGNAKTNADVLILATSYDAYDHYQDGYQAVSVPVFYKWWKEQTATGTKATNEIVVISPKTTVELQIVGEGESDNILTNPFYAERHMLLNADGTFGGALNGSLYGTEGTALNGTYVNGDTYEYVDAPEYNYFGKADYYNMTDTSSLTICENFMVFEQTMASSCGICSTLNTLNYLGYDFTQLDNYVETRSTQSNYTVGEIVKVTLSDGSTEVGSFDKVQEALVNIYMQGDSYFNDSTKKFNNYGGVGASTLKKLGQAIGLSPTTGNFSVKEGATASFTSYADFVTYIKGRLSENLPTVICWAPGSGHYETIIGFDDMGTESAYDDVIVLADSADSHDQYQDGYNTYPASQFFAQWYNGTASVGQVRVEYSAIS